MRFSCILAVGAGPSARGAPKGTRAPETGSTGSCSVLGFTGDLSAARSSGSSAGESARGSRMNALILLARESNFSLSMRMRPRLCSTGGFSTTFGPCRTLVFLTPCAGTCARSSGIPCSSRKASGMLYCAIRSSELRSPPMSLSKTWTRSSPCRSLTGSVSASCHIGFRFLKITRV